MKKRALVVDDDESVRSVLEQTLLAEQFEVFVASDGQHALSLLDRIQLPHVIVTDFNMEPMNGAEFVSRLKSNPILKHIPVLIVTAQKSIEVAGVEQVIEKPFVIDHLLSAISDALRRK